MRELFQLCFNKRFRKIIFLFITFVVQFWWLKKIKRFLSEEELEMRYKALYKKQAEYFTVTATDLGGLLIKLGQFFSSRIDVLPKEYTEELSKLQDAVEPVETQLVIERIEREFNKKITEVYNGFSNNSLAAASLGQVHIATLKDNQKVAVKILRPGIEEIIRIDLEALKLITTFAKRYPNINNLMDLDAIYLEFMQTVNDELDYKKEAASAETFRTNFANDEGIYIPSIHWDFTTEKVLTMEYIDGDKINSAEQIANEKIDQENVSNTLFAAFLKQFLIDGFFHADPHPGNILLKKDGTIVLLDFGMVGIVDANIKENIVELLTGAYKKDAGAVVEAFDKLGFLRPHADRNTLMKSVTFLLSNLFGDISDINKITSSDFADEIREFFRSQPFQLPAQTLFLGKSFTTVLGICNGLSSDFDIIKVAKPYVEDLLSDDKEFAPKDFLLNQVKKTVSEVITLPEKLNRLVNGLESGDIRFSPSKSFERKLLDYQSTQTDRVVRAVISIGFLISGTLLLNGDLQNLGIAFMLGGLYLAMKAFVNKSVSSNQRRRMSMAGTGFKKPKFHP